MIAIYKEYSDLYRAATTTAINQSKALNFPHLPKVTPDFSISEDHLAVLVNYSRIELIKYLAQAFPRPYWGDICLGLASHIFACLNAIELPAEIVFGEVNINGTDEYDVVLDNLIYEYKYEVRSGIQNIHAWVTVGDDIIIDAAMPDRLVKYYGVPLDYLPEILVGRAYELKHKFRCQYKPMLVGSDFIAKTNSYDPLNLCNDLKLLINP